MKMKNHEMGGEVASSRAVAAIIPKGPSDPQKNTYAWDGPHSYMEEKDSELETSVKKIFDLYAHPHP